MDKDSDKRLDKTEIVDGLRLLGLPVSDLQRETTYMSLCVYVCVRVNSVCHGLRLLGLPVSDLQREPTFVCVCMCVCTWIVASVRFAALAHVRVCVYIYMYMCVYVCMWIVYVMMYIPDCVRNAE
jgi:hypothetical protein